MIAKFLTLVTLMAIVVPWHVALAALTCTVSGEEATVSGTMDVPGFVSDEPIVGVTPAATTDMHRSNKQSHSVGRDERPSYIEGLTAYLAMPDCGKGKGNTPRAFVESARNAGVPGSVVANGQARINARYPRECVRDGYLWGVPVGEKGGVFVWLWHDSAHEQPRGQNPKTRVSCGR